MADDNMIQANTTRDWGHQLSPLFKLPAEVRNNIYRETFAGSEIALVFDPPLWDQVVPVTGRRSIFVDANRSHNFLLTCAQVYLEALALYWSSTTVRSGSDRFSRGFFLSRIPELARPYIQHLRAIDTWPVESVKKLRGEVIRWPLSLAESLDSFPSLKSCSVLQSLFSPDHQGAIREAVDRHPGVQIVEKRTAVLRDRDMFSMAAFQSWDQEMRVRKQAKAVSKPSFLA